MVRTPPNPKNSKTSRRSISKSKMEVRRLSHHHYSVTLDDRFFQDMVREVVMEMYGKDETGRYTYCFQSPALRELQDGAEDFLSKMWWHVTGFAKRHHRFYPTPEDFETFKGIERFQFMHRSLVRGRLVKK